jgi:hypothetical protein
MSTFKRIDYFRVHDSIRQRLNLHFSSQGVLVECHKDAKRIAARRWVADVHVPNLPMTMTFYGPSQMQALKNADFLLQYYIQGPSTPRRAEYNL